MLASSLGATVDADADIRRALAGEGRSQRARAALVNLALNARDAMPNGGIDHDHCRERHPVARRHRGRTRGRVRRAAPSPTPASGIPPDLSPRCSIRSSRPRAWTRAAGSGCRRCTASPTSRAARVDDRQRARTRHHGHALPAAQPRRRAAAEAAAAADEGRAARCCWSRTIPRSPRSASHAGAARLSVQAVRTPRPRSGGRASAVRPGDQRHRHGRRDGRAGACPRDAPAPAGSAGAAGHRLQRAAAEVAGEFTVLRKPYRLAELSRAATRMIAEETAAARSQRRAPARHEADAGPRQELNRSAKQSQAPFPANGRGWARGLRTSLPPA